MKRAVLSCLALLSLSTDMHAALAADLRPQRSTSIAARMADPKAGIIVVAHRGCHNPAPGHGMPAAPENSFAALDKCVALDIDVMEVDVRKTADGRLVLMHDEKVDRTTDGQGQLSGMTLAQVKALHLRDNGGGPQAPVTDQRVPTLAEILARAGGEILFCLDVKEAIFPEVAAEVQKAGATAQVFFQPAARIDTAPLASSKPFDQFAVIPALAGSDQTGNDLPQVLENQSRGLHRPWGYSLPWSSKVALVDPHALTQLAASAHNAKGRLFLNTMAFGTIIGMGGDREALHDPDGVWGAQYRAGVTMFQTDEPEALKAYVVSVSAHAGDTP